MCSNVRPRQPTWSIIILISRKNLLINLQLPFFLVVLTSAGEGRWQLFCGDWGYEAPGDCGYLHLLTRLLNTEYWILCSFFPFVVVFRGAINHLMRSLDENFTNEDRELQIRNYFTLLETRFQTFLVNPVYFQSITLPNKPWDLIKPPKQTAQFVFGFWRMCEFRYNFR